MEMIEANWLLIGAALVLALLVLWWLFARTSKPAERTHKPDVLDEGVGPAQRNQALIDAPPSAQIVTPLPASATMAGLGEVVAVAAQDAVEEVEARVQEVAPPPPLPPPPQPVPEPEPEPEIVPEPEPVEIPAPDPEQSLSPNLNSPRKLSQHPRRNPSPSRLPPPRSHPTTSAGSRASAPNSRRCSPHWG